MSSSALKSDRQDAIVAEVLRRGTATVAELAAHLGVSAITVRRDLEELDAAGRLQRVHGGARRQMPREPEPPVVQRQAQQAREKQAIARLAAGLVRDGEVIGIESGSTTFELARVLATRPWRGLQLVTNSFTVANALILTPGVHLVFVGGNVHADEMGTFGDLATEALKRLHIGKLFITCRALDPQAGLTNDVHAEKVVSTERALVAAARQRIVLADHTKLGQTFLMQIVPIEDVDTVVTDDLAPPEILEELRRRDIEVVVASTQESQALF
ncbi:MAG: DeoR/GlpR family DNA-binding transcription regulator [Anaerolineae bacterium]